MNGPLKSKLVNKKSPSKQCVGVMQVGVMAGTDVINFHQWHGQ